MFMNSALFPTFYFSYQNFKFSKNQNIPLHFQQNLSKILEIDQNSITIFEHDEVGKLIRFQINEQSTIQIEINEKQLFKLKSIYGSSSALKLNGMFQQSCLNLENFNLLFNREWKNENGCIWEYRGQLNERYKYFYPIGWKGIGLNITNKYASNSWFNEDSNKQWRILYQPTGQYPIDVTMMSFKVGQDQKYKNQICRLTGRKIGIGIYLTNHIEVAEKLSKPIQIENQFVKIVFQVRVNPKALKQCQKESEILEMRGNEDWDHDFFVINEPSDIRPYRVLIKLQK